MTDWTRHPLERARYLDGEGSPEERAARAADLLREPAARARLDADARFHRLVATGRQALPVPSDLLLPRVRAALAADRAAGFPSTGAGDRLRTRRRVGAVAAAAAAVVAAIAVWSASDRVPTSGAADREVLLAADAYRSAVVGVLPPASGGGTCDEGPASPARFPLVASGEVAVEACKPDGDRTSVAVLRRTDDARTEKGLVVVPWDGRSAATDVGYTRVDEVVVFDVAIGRAKYFLATRWQDVAGTPMCAACHGPARASNPARNPHRFVERAPVVVQRAR